VSDPQDRAPQDSQESPRPVRRAASGGRPRPPRPDDDEYVVLPPDTKGGRRVLAVAGVVVALIGVFIVVGILWASRQINPSGGQGALVAEVVVPPGSSTDSIGQLLDDKGIISGAQMFKWYTGWKGSGPWKAGRYVEFHENSSYDEAIGVLDQGPVPANANTVRIPEGKRLIDALAIITKSLPNVTLEQLVTALQSGQVTSKYKPADVSNWEGFLFPDTYEFSDKATAVEVLQTMATKMDRVLDELGYDKAEALQGRTAYELVTTASLIEKEVAAVPSDLPKAARVIYNRLDAGEPLGIDAAIFYGLGRAGGELTKSELAQPTPYNNRLVKGLPPTPICLPSKASLQAAIQPADGNWKYYLQTELKPPQFLFTDSYAEFQKAKADAKARGVF
jgi:UPF0755 protein